MQVEQIKDRLLETSGTARRIYGIKLTLKNGLTDQAKWFLFNREKLKFAIALKEDGIVLDIGSYKGEFSEAVFARNNNLVFWLYEPISEFFEISHNRFKDNNRVLISQSAVSADGRDFEMRIDGLRSRKQEHNNFDSIPITSVSIQKIFDSSKEFELLKMNIEGMEFECLEKLLSTKSLKKAKYLLIQFHNLDKNSLPALIRLREEFANDFYNVWKYDWMWELWERKSE